MSRLPPFAGLRAFEAAARHLSFKRAAAELGVTPTAVSHQVKQLERSTGKRLFVRHTRRVALTADGSAFADAIKPAMDTLAAAFAALQADTQRQQVTLGAGPIFSSRWLVLRLGDFWSAHPGIDLWLHHSPLPVWQQLTHYDLAVSWGDGLWPGMISEPLLRIEVTPVVSPALLGKGTSLDAETDLLALPLLHHANSGGWRQWFNTVGVAAPAELPGIVFEDANVLLQAALAGRGAALGILQFIEDDLAAGRLVRPFPTSVDPGEAYFLVRRRETGGEGDDAVKAVRAWLLGE